MRPIGEIKDEAEAKRFGDFLYANEIHCDVDEDEDGWTIWIHDDDKIAKAESELAEFLKTPGHPRYTQASARAEKIRQDEAKEEERATRRQVDVRTEVFGGVQATPYLSYCLIGICLMVQLLQMTDRNVDFLRMSTIDITTEAKASMNQAQETEYRLRNVFLPEITGKKIALQDGEQVAQRGQIWRIVTPIFLHFGLLHIIFNMYWLYFLGGGLEGKLGLGRTLGFILLAAVVSNLGQYLLSGPAFGGMSGVNYALFGYIWIRGKNDPRFGLQLDQGTITMLLIWFVVCFTGLVGNIANAAHTLGLIVGVIAGWLAAQRALR